MKLGPVERANLRGRLLEDSDAFSAWRKQPTRSVEDLGPTEWYEFTGWLFSCLTSLTSSLGTLDELWSVAKQLYERAVAGKKAEPDSDVPQQILFYLMDLHHRGQAEVQVSRLAAVTGLPEGTVLAALNQLEAMEFAYQSADGWYLSFGAA